MSYEGIAPDYQATSIKNIGPGELFFVYSKNIVPCIKVIGDNKQEYILYLDEFALRSIANVDEMVLKVCNKWRFSFTDLMPSQKERNPVSPEPGNIGIMDQGPIFYANCKREFTDSVFIQIGDWRLVNPATAKVSYYGKWKIEIQNDDTGAWEYLYPLPKG